MQVSLETFVTPPPVVCPDLPRLMILFARVGGVAGFGDADLCVIPKPASFFGANAPHCPGYRRSLDIAVSPVPSK